MHIRESLCRAVGFLLIANAALGLPFEAGVSLETPGAGAIVPENSVVQTGGDSVALLVQTPVSSSITQASVSLIRFDRNLGISEQNQILEIKGSNACLVAGIGLAPLSDGRLAALVQTSNFEYEVILYDPVQKSSSKFVPFSQIRKMRLKGIGVAPDGALLLWGGEDDQKAILASFNLDGFRNWEKTFTIAKEVRDARFRSDGVLVLTLEEGHFAGKFGGGEFATTLIALEPTKRTEVAKVKIDGGKAKTIISGNHSIVFVDVAKEWRKSKPIVFRFDEDLKLLWQRDLPALNNPVYSLQLSASGRGDAVFAMVRNGDISSGVIGEDGMIKRQTVTDCAKMGAAYDITNIWGDGDNGYCASFTTFSPSEDKTSEHSNSRIIAIE